MTGPTFAHPLKRRTVLKGAAWSVPAVSLAVAAPAMAASPVPTIMTTSLPVGYIGESYVQTLVADAGTTPYSWAGATAPGLAVTSDGLVAGTPTAAGQTQMAVTVTDAKGQTDAAQIPVNIGTDRTAAAAEMLRLINDRRIAIGVAPMTHDPALDTQITTWVEGLAAAGSGLAHQSPLPTGVRAENLSATCNSAPVTGSPVSVGASLTNGWLGEPYSYTDYMALRATDPDKAQRMYHGTGEYAAVGASGHRINLENPAYSSIGFGVAYGVSGSACGSSYPYGYYGGTAQA
ncbi:MAG: CAP domain-containing protein [Propionibacteriaceae bacterium]|nr:CAP domain-containing protein [Propionibacteriaceae bacterium]